MFNIFQRARRRIIYGIRILSCNGIVLTSGIQMTSRDWMIDKWWEPIGDNFEEAKNRAEAIFNSKGPDIDTIRFSPENLGKVVVGFKILIVKKIPYKKWGFIPQEKEEVLWENAKRVLTEIDYIDY
jgi:hypothetical protein